MSLHIFHLNVNNLIANNIFLISINF